MISTKKKVTLSAAAMAFLALGAVSMSGMARTSPGIDHYAAPADVACMQESWGSVINTCSTTRGAFFPTPVDNSGSKTVKLTARSDDSSKNVCCHALGIDASATFVWGSAWACLPAFGSAQTLTMTGASVPSGGTMYVYCDVGAGAKVASVNYSP
jgi:hypothetical protein